MSSALGTLRRRLLGLLLVVLIAAFFAVTILFYNKAFTPTVPITLDAGSAGNEMSAGADVMVRGLVVGSVRSVSSTGDGAVLTLNLDPDQAKLIPANVTAELLPKSLFGERYVDLEIPTDPASSPIAGGAVIGENRSSTAIAVEQVLDDLMPVLQAVQPQKLSVTLTAIATALQGRGPELGSTLSQLGQYVGQLNPHLPTLEHDLSALATTTNTYNQAAPQLINALSDLSVTSQTVVAEQANLQNLYGTLTTASDTLTNFLDANKNNLIQVTKTSAPILDMLAEYSPEYPCFLKQMVQDEGKLNTAFGAGTDEPGLHATLEVSVSRGAYVAGQDTPEYNENRGPRCYDFTPAPTPFPQYAPDGPLDDGSTHPPAAHSSSSGLLPSTGTQSTSSQSANTDGLGLPNSAAEQGFIAELAAGGLGVTPQQVPNWASVLIGPIYRGTEVTLK
ncbi:MAG TPA: MCE family protein [Pseudonocardiaceae bacterium]|jgi:virulence factor Mce-like protein|nr:MCE family protein [Pseudonocardiaceae bacterium]